MRINNYSKFFSYLSNTMNTSIKAIKQLDGRYKVELTNHVHFYAFRGATGGLFIHDHRGISPIISCYNFEDFKTLKDLYDRLVSDFCEEDCIENAECSRGNDVFKGCKTVKEVMEEYFGYNNANIDEDMKIKSIDEIIVD